MNTEQTQLQDTNEDETYLKIWQVDQEFVKTRWSVTTFFMSISFAILGFSFQSSLRPQESFAIRVAGIFIYWFACFLYSRFYGYTRFLRSYLIEMEKAKRTRLDIQSKAYSSTHGGTAQRISTGRWIFVFGLIYTVGVILLLLLRI